MTFDAALDRRLADVPGFGRCQTCMYVDTGSPALCSRCASRTMEALPEPEQRCPVCEHPFNEGEALCRNGPCNAGWREFDRNYAIAVRSGQLDRVIKRYKYQGARGWGRIFARILVGFLDANTEQFAPYDLITSSPTYVGPNGRDFDHTGEVLVYANDDAAGRWPFDLGDPPVIVKTAATQRLVEAGGYQDRKAVAQGELRAALSVPDRAATAGKGILIYDDVFTDGLSLNEAARALRRQGGARRVSGITLARSIYGRR
jgi:predicted amidophosphoribosyltransferase